jgi:hypothetical protein
LIVALRRGARASGEQAARACAPKPPRKPN